MEEILTDILRRVQGKYYGKYRGFVHDNKDPEKRGRLRVRIPSVLGAQATDWALPCVPFGGSTGFGWFAIPENDAQIWVEFEEGDVRHPIWTGTFWQQAGDPPADGQKDQPTTRILQTVAGHILQFDDEEGAERVLVQHRGGAAIVIDENGTITVTDQAGNAATLDADEESIRLEDASGNVVTMDSDGVTISDANDNTIELGASGIKLSAQQIVLDAQVVEIGGSGGEPVIKGTSFIKAFMLHAHGPPGSPPTTPLDPTILSTGVQTK